MPESVIAFDFGTKSIGVAASIDVRHTLIACSELPPLKAIEGIPDWVHLGSLLQHWQPALVLVGLPFDARGEDMEITRRARKFGNRIHGRFGVKVEFVDETLSTRSAKEEARERGHRGSFAKQPVDSIAARLILESWLGKRKST